MAGRDRKVFYGWWIVAGGFVLNFIGIGIGINAIGVFFKPVTESLGFGRGDFSLYFTIAALSMTVAAPIVGKLMEKYDVRLIMGICTALLALGFGLYSRCSTLPQFYLLSILVGIGHGGSHIIPVSTMIGNWFKEKRGLAMGIVFTATGLGGVLFNPLADWLIRTYGWRQSYVILALVIGLTCVPTSIIVMRLSPRDKGLVALGATEEGSSAEGSTLAAPVEGLSLGDFVKRPAFWFLALMVLLINTLNMGIQQHLIPYLTDLGHDSSFAADIMGLYLGMTILGKLVLGRLCDIGGLAKGLVIFIALVVLGILALLGSRLALFAVLFGLVYGFGNAIQTVLPPLMTSELAGMRHYPLIYGIVSIFQTLGSGIGTPLSGYIYDSRGSYAPAFWLYVAMACLAAAFGILAMRGRRLGAAASAG